MRILKLIFLVFISFNSFAQKKDVIVEISDLKEQVKKLQMENEKLSTELIHSNSKNENRILDLGVKLENLQFEFNVLKRLVEQYRNGENIPKNTIKDYENCIAIVNTQQLNKLNKITA
jgi:archaellum component FlaC